MSREASAADRTERYRWIAFSAVCLGLLMIVLDGTIVYVALPSIRTDLRLNDASLAWVANSYTLTYAGFLLLGGRLADVYGQRRVFLAAIGLFTLASLACGLARTEELLLIFRGVQGIGGALINSTALALLLITFPSDEARAKAMGALAFVGVGGGSVGFLLGGVITAGLNWHWIFLVNLPVGVLIFVFVFYLFKEQKEATTDWKIDFWGASTITMSLMFATYAILSERPIMGEPFWKVGLFVAALLLFIAFLTIERFVESPLVPLGIFRRRDFAFASVVSFLWGMAAASLFFVGLYMQIVLGCGPMQAGLAFLPMSATAAVFSLGLSARIVSQFGIKLPLSFGLLVAALSLALVARVPVTGSLTADVLPSMVLFGIGVGMTGSPLLLAATRDALPTESGLASGVFGTASLTGSMFGIAILASVSTGHADTLLASGFSSPVALAQGYRVALLGGAACAGLASLVAGLCLRTKYDPPVELGIPRV